MMEISRLIMKAKKYNVAFKHFVSGFIKKMMDKKK